MSKIDVKVYALPTNKATYIQLGVNLLINIPGQFRGTYFNLYVTTSETPKEGDWFIVEISEDNWETSNFVLEQVETINGIWVNNESYETTRHINNCRKVVATDNSELHYKGVFNEKLQRRTFGDVPQISPEFKQAWVREANKGTPILEALMEFTDLGKDACKFDDNHLDSKIENLEHNCLIFGGKCSCLKKIPKLNPQGYVTILRVKEKMHTQTEVENLILQFASDCENDEDLICYDGEIDGVKQYNAAKKWLKQNL